MPVCQHSLHGVVSLRLETALSLRHEWTVCRATQRKAHKSYAIAAYAVNKGTTGYAMRDS